jgi:hypothetical protein
MSIPSPQPGLVISYSFLWNAEHRKGRDEGAKDRPCVIVLSTFNAADGKTMVRVAPITHTPPVEPGMAIEIPAPVKRHLGLDDQRSWVMLDEMNTFAWPGFDLRPINRQSDRFDYGFLPPRLFADLVAHVRTVWRDGHGKSTPRD